MDAIGKSGSKVISLLEKRIEKLKDELDELEKRKGELQALIANSPSKVNAQIVLDALRDFSELFKSLNPTERAEYLQRIVRDIVITEDKILINIFGLSKPPSGALNERNGWLPVRVANQRDDFVFIISIGYERFQARNPNFYSILLMLLNTLCQ